MESRKPSIDLSELPRLQRETPYEEVIHISGFPFARHGSGLVELWTGYGHSSEEEARKSVYALKRSGRRKRLKFIREFPREERPRRPKPQKVLKLAIKLNLSRLSYREVSEAWDLASDIAGSASFGPKAIRVPLEHGPAVVEALKESGYPVLSTKEVYTYY